MQDDDVVSVYVTAASPEEARALARAVLAPRLAACANVVPAVESLYWWDGRLEEAREAAVVFKTRRDRVDALAATVRAASSYDVPCVAVWPVVGGNAAYLDWVRSEARPRPEP
ncbi:MAG TPA: divalent-cation tolerance protein CutA [Candidatus Thermoplasmatota archaeon]|nr:divalent-cation tolerance protein CutA [Candidatus Thermoplasmatota archaeon]